jgi:hypothetical protein
LCLGEIGNSFQEIFENQEQTSDLNEDKQQPINPK